MKNKYIDRQLKVISVYIIAIMIILVGSITSFSENKEYKAEDILVLNNGNFELNIERLPNTPIVEIMRINIHILKFNVNNIKDENQKVRVKEAIDSLMVSGEAKNDKPVIDEDVEYIRGNKMFVPPSYLSENEIHNNDVEFEGISEIDTTADLVASEEILEGDNSEFIDEVKITGDEEVVVDENNSSPLISSNIFDTPNINYEQITELVEGQDYNWDEEETFINEEEIQLALPENKKKRVVVDNSRLGNISVTTANADDVEKMMKEVSYSSSSLLASVRATMDSKVYDSTGRVVNFEDSEVPQAPRSIPMTPIKRIYETSPYLNTLLFVLMFFIFVATCVILYKQGDDIRKMEDRNNRRQMFLFRDEAPLAFDNYDDDRFTVGSRKK